MADLLTAAVVDDEVPRDAEQPGAALGVRSRPDVGAANPNEDILRQVAGRVGADLRKLGQAFEQGLGLRFDEQVAVGAGQIGPMPAPAGQHALDARVGVLQIRPRAALGGEHAIPVEHVVLDPVVRKICVLQGADADLRGERPPGDVITFWIAPQQFRFRPFDRFVQQRLFDPLKMTSSFWTVPARDASRLATNYAIVGDQLSPLDPGATSVWLTPPSFPYGGAGLVMSARDYDRFLHMLADEGTLDGVRVMKPETVRLAMSNLLPAGVTFGGVEGNTGGTQAATPMGFGAGGSVYLADGPGGMPSKGTYGWGGAAGTVAFVDPVKKVRGTIMVNYFPADRWPVRQETVRALAADLSRFKR